ncbi:MerR family transcriptional regulator [Teredinibacter turnerae]|uniref:MerR family transcriptional regulator n=1 Tax=Teredinibacter turnerae TaxID=2426 RepID=UPI00037372D1|nr:MerR family DNA-binding protein [Teredinibacter turnerae]
MRVKDLAIRLDVNPDTIRFYTRKGFIKPFKNTENGYQDFSLEDEARARFILGARGLGFTVADIEEILAVSDEHHTPCPLVRDLIEQRLQETEERFNEMQRLRDRMRLAVAEWKNLPDSEPKGRSICNLIESFNHNQHGKEK